MPETTGNIVSLKGLNERMILGSSLDQTTSLDNVIVRNGYVQGRKGLALWDGISTAAAAQVIGLGAFYVAISASSQLLRMQPTSMQKWNSGTHAWDDITGTALNGTTSDRPNFVTLTDEGFLVFCNEGHDRPRKYTGSGNTVQLGGTPPFCMTLEGFEGFLMLGNTSSNGTFNAVGDPITITFSDVPDSNWSPCDANTMVMDESGGEIRRLLRYGKVLLCYKSDCIVQIRFVGGTTRFNRDPLPFDLGLLAPLSAVRIAEFGHIFLATDRNLYSTDGFVVKALPINVQKSLQETMTAARAPYCRGFLDIDHETYHLLYQRNGTTNFDGRLSYNYRTQEFYRGAWTGYEMTAALGYKQTNNSATQLVAANGIDNKVYEVENGTDDAGTKVSRYYDIDWNQYGSPGSKYFMGANLAFKHSTNTQVRISVAADHSHIFQYPRMHSLKGKFPSDENTRVQYSVPSPVYGSWFKLRVEFFHYGSTNVVELRELEPIIMPVHATPKDQPKQPQAQRT